MTLKNRGSDERPNRRDKGGSRSRADLTFAPTSEPLASVPPRCLSQELAKLTMTELASIPPELPRLCGVISIHSRVGSFFGVRGRARSVSSMRRSRRVEMEEARVHPTTGETL